MKTELEPISKEELEKAKTKEREIVQEAVKRFKKCLDFESRNRALASEDVDFRHGDQWPEAIKSQREKDSRPCLTFNKMEQRIDQVIGDQRQAKPAIKILPAEPDTDKKGKNKAGDKDYTLSQVMNGLIRAIEQNSDAQIAYNTGFDHAVGHGFGYWRILTEYDEQNPFEQVIKIARIKNSFSVYLDPMTQMPHAGDMQYGFITSMMDEAVFKEKYPNATATSIDVAGYGDDYDWWFEEGTVRVAEYFRKVPVNKIAVLATDGSVSHVDDKEALEKYQSELERKGMRVQKWKEVTVSKVEWYKINAYEVLEEPREFPSFYIPIIRVIGRELNREGYDYFRGIVRHAKDAQRMYNYDRTAMVEQTALQPKVPFIMTAEQVDAYETSWARANKDNLAYLLYNHVDGVPPPQRSMPPVPSTAHQINALADDADVDSTTGLGPASLGQKSNERSGKAIRERKLEGDVGTFTYHDNLQIALKQTGRILVDMIPRIYDTARVTRIITPEEDDDFIELNRTIVGEDGKVQRIHDLGAGKYDVRVTAGPSYTTMREEARESMMEFARYLPNSAALIADMIAENMDWPKSEAVAERLKKILPPGIAEDDSKEDEGPSPQEIEQMMQQVAQQVQEDLDNKVRQMEVEIKAFTAQEKADSNEMKNMIEAMKALEGKQVDEEAIKDLVAQAFAELITER